MTIAYELNGLNPESFENMVNLLALRVLGAGATGFGPGSDGGRDGYFVGEAPYPSESEHWKGTWYIQSKFYKPGGTKTDHQWLVDQVKAEISAFEEDDNKRIWPDNWIIATNVNPGGKPETGSFDAIQALLRKNPNAKNVKLAIWGGRKILDLLVSNKDVAESFGHFMTPGNVISKLYNDLAWASEDRATLSEIIRYFVVSQFSENLYTKLEQAGSASDIRPAVHDLFIDLPFSEKSAQSFEGTYDDENKELLSTLCKATAQSHRNSIRSTIPEKFRNWSRLARRARVTVIKGGPGQGKSTIGQYLSQIQRAAFIVGTDGPNVTESIKSAANTLRKTALASGYWPNSPRIPIQMELKEYAHWHSTRAEGQVRNILLYLAEVVGRRTAKTVSAGMIKAALAKQAWLIIFDGLDEVPNDHKNEVAKEIIHFMNDTVIEVDADLLAVCSSRPQGYSGQFDSLDGAEVVLSRLTSQAALSCAKPLLQFNRSSEEAEKSFQILEAAILSPNILELMTTPLQSHIMAIVIRDGGKPPERRWRLFQSFYQVMKRRESQKGFKSPLVAELLQGEDRLLKGVHMRLGFVLHAKAEKSSGAQSVLSRAEFRDLVGYVVNDLGAENIQETIDALMEATTERLVLVSTPDSGDQVRFDIRQLQEFFAAEFLYDGVTPSILSDRVEVIGTDAHWREVMHFLLSALIADRRTTELAVAIQVLNRFNQGEVTKGDSLLRRRSAHATNLAMRLIGEGVVEDDQKDRRSLKSLISDVGGIMDLSVLSNLMQISQRNSRSWVVDVLVERINISSQNEYIGALFSLATLLPDSSVHNGFVIDAFFRLKKEAAETFLHELMMLHHNISDENRRGRREFSKSSLWILQVCVKILSSEKWIQYSAGTTSVIIDILRQNGDRMKEAFFFVGLAENISKLVIEYLISRDPVGSDDKLGPSVNCGPLIAREFTQSWKSSNVPANVLEVDAVETNDSIGGAVLVVLKILEFAQLRTLQALREFRESMSGVTVDYIQDFPSRLLAFVPLGGEGIGNDISLKHLRDIEKYETLENFFSALITKLPPSYADFRIATTKDDNWEEFAEKLPRFALRFLFEPAESSIMSIEKTVGPVLRELIQKNLSDVAGRILSWSQLSDIDPELFLYIRRAVCEMDFSMDFEYEGFSRSIMPFIIDLPSEKPLLPLLALALSSSFRGLTSYTDVLDKFGLKISELRDIALNFDLPKIIRAGALALFWRGVGSSGADLDLAVERSLYEQTVSELSASWLSHALVNGILVHRCELEFEAIATVNLLFEKNLNGVVRPHIIRLIRVWRERSNAPVASSKVLAEWLGYSDKTPSYAKLQ